MRLLERQPDGNLILREFTDRDVPAYAILSHTWLTDNNEEVSFQDVRASSGKSKVGWEKITFCADRAEADALRYFWVDTCCIDKSSSSELGESINSMFEWYKNAKVCYVYLADLPSDSDMSILPRCRWFSRGWTLQELIAPDVVQFYDSKWNAIGTKVELVDIISACTGISSGHLLGHSVLSDASVATRMSWAARRQTTRSEDQAYCLLGIFEVNMPLIYGEGMRAFRRLQEEIVKRDDDLTIFAWDLPLESRSQFVGPFAPSPSAFTASSGVVPYSEDWGNFSVTNRGLFFTGGIIVRVAKVQTEQNGIEMLYCLCLGINLPNSKYSLASRRDVGIYLRKVGPQLFRREGLLPLAGLETEIDQIEMYTVSEMYILLRTTSAIAEVSSSFRNLAIHASLSDAFKLQEAVPEALWDHSDRLFLRPSRYRWTNNPTVLAMRIRMRLLCENIPLVLLCDCRGKGPILKIFNEKTYLREKKIIFQQRYLEEGITWEDMEIKAPSIQALCDSMTIRTGTRLFVVTAVAGNQSLMYMSRNVRIWGLSLSISEVETR